MTMAMNSPSPRNFLVVVFMITNLFPNLRISETLIINTCPTPPELSNRLQVDPAAIESVSTDYGNIVHDKPAAVLYPTSVQDIWSLANASFRCSVPYGISARGNGHCTRGQDMAYNGVVVDMKGLRDIGKGISINKQGLFADVGGEQLWIDVLNATVKEGVAPVSWTDFLYLSVGGTLSNAGISGQAFRYGPQITNVYEMDVVTGKAELITCSANNNSELFYAVLGGLGQFGIITRARIALGPALNRVAWVQILYSNFTDFTEAQEYFISLHGKKQGNNITYLEGGILLDNGTPNTWRTFFFPPADISNITSLIKRYGIIYSLELALSYDNTSKGSIEKELKRFMEGLKTVPQYSYGIDVSYIEFLTRVQITVQKNESHPWLNLFIPKSGVSDFNSGVFRDIILKQNITTGPVLFYPLLRDKWDDRMSAAIPDEDIFYTVAILYTSGVNDWQVYENQNKAILDFCDKAGIKIKQYLPNYDTKEEWITHFGSKWATFEQRKALFDPKMILSPGQRIFNNISIHLN
ncbi:cytokinin dehydrogenase 3-like [Jatropha curcas]|uniref:cytokinin dehydrogenase 3-like n=1 Tax=Jatropha curcas TaxID=180498 RepID=UPI0009D6A1DE|nr:cytokinin dehydrogenase 3-like [Jatropha curcas]